MLWAVRVVTDGSSLAPVLPSSYMSASKSTKSSDKGKKGIHNAAVTSASVAATMLEGEMRKFGAE